MITQSSLRERLRYDPDTGEFWWRDCRSNRDVTGQIAGWNNGKNAWRISIDGRCYLAHRLAWLYVHGTQPSQIDHINGNRADNRLCNLRPANNSQNQANMGAKRNSRLGIRGVGFQGGLYIVQLRKGAEHVRKSFATLAAAQEFAIAESKRLHGDFSVHQRAVLR